MKHIFSLLLTLMAANCYAASFAGIEALVERQVPFLKGKVVFHTYAAPKPIEQRDAFRISAAGGLLTIEATSPSAAAMAVNHYIKRYCHMSISHAGSNIHALSTLPDTRGWDSVSSPMRWRYALNYCTYNYTYSFYSWTDWQWELDYLALNGVNLMLAPMGTEAVWQRLLRDIGMSKADIDAFLPGPAFNAWWLMGNLQGWGGPVSDALINQWKSIQQQMLDRMAEIGITPALQGFYGMVPLSLQGLYPNAAIAEQGEWAGGFQRPALLLPQDSLFGRMAALYYRYMKEYYGAAAFFGGDLFHEGGSAAGIDVTLTARLVQSHMQKHNPGAVWLLQGWGGNPKPALLDGLDKQSILVIDLFGESQRNWEKRNEYDGAPWLWASVNNFGGKAGMGAQLPTLIQEPHRARAYSLTHRGAMQGIGIIPEGIDANPIAYDWALQAAWETAAPDPDHYLRRYITYRYGKWNDTIYKAWQILLSSVYSDYQHKGEGTYESILCARPSIGIRSVSTWGPRTLQYDPVPLVDALRMMRSAARHLSQSAAYQYDLTDLARQVNANRARTIYAAIERAYEQKDTTALRRRSAIFLALILRQDSLLATNEHFLLGRWLARAKQYGGSSHQDQALCLLNARTQITYWGPANPQTNLHDYAHKEWSGLLRTLYHSRWSAFLADLLLQAQGAPPKNINYYEMERQWAASPAIPSPHPSGDYLEEVDKTLRTP